MAISDAGLKLIEQFEGFRPRLYADAAGHITVGIGHLVHRAPTDDTTDAELVEFKRLEDQYKDGITHDQAVELLKQDLKVADDAINRLVTVPLTQGQYDGLCSFTYNLGAGVLERSTLLRLLNKGKYDLAADQFMAWDRAGGKVVAGLTRRREAEREMFIDG